MLTNSIGNLNETWYYTPGTSANSGVMKGEDTGEKPKTEMNISSLQKDDFLKLLLAQLRNQDPLNPADNTEFVAQLAQFSTLEQMTQVNSNLEKSLETSSKTSETINNAMMISYFGKNVLAETADFTYDGGTPVKLNFNFDSASVGGKLEIVNAGGTVVRSISLGVQEAGNHTYTWDGMSSRGGQANAGEYMFRITAEDAAGSKIEWTPMFSGVVEGISRKEGQSYLFAGGIYIPFDKVRHISESE